ncbi:splicing factor U2AF-associated protein [Chloropicon primus]|nr:splicing factor U2AF-associated protein [Chloropicon primus]
MVLAGIRERVLSTVANAKRKREPPNGEHEFTDDDGTRYEWSVASGNYVPVVDAKEKKGKGAKVGMESSAGYSMAEMTYEEENAEVAAGGRGKDKPSTSGSGQGSKGGVNEAKVGAALERERQRQKELMQAKKSKEGWFSMSNNTSVYVKGLPDNTTEEEMEEFFKKCGVIKLDENGKPKIKIYTDGETGEPKGDGLVTYLKAPSVELACQILDGAQFRPGSDALSVAAAKFEMKGEAYVKKKRTATDAKRIKRMKEKQEQKALDWSGFDDPEHKSKDVTAIMKYLFDPKEVERGEQSEETFFRELEQDIREECATKCGEVKKVKIYRYNPQGVVSVCFKLPQAAAKCVSIMHGRWFGGKQIEADLFDGHTNYFVKKMEETEEEQQRRLDRFAADLEQ